MLCSLASPQSVEKHGEFGHILEILEILDNRQSRFSAVVPVKTPFKMTLDSVVQYFFPYQKLTSTRQFLLSRPQEENRASPQGTPEKLWKRRGKPSKDRRISKKQGLEGQVNSAQPRSIDHLFAKKRELSVLKANDHF